MDPSNPKASPSPPPSASYWKREAIELYTSMGIKRSIAEFLFEGTKVANNYTIVGVALAVLVSLFYDGAFGSMAVIYFVCQPELCYSVCYEMIYLLTFDGSLLKGAPRVPLLLSLVLPVAGYVFTAMTIRTVGMVLWVIGALLQLFLLFGTFLSVVEVAIRQIVVGLPENPGPFLDLVLGLPWDSYLDHLRVWGTWLVDLYRDHMRKRLLNLWSSYGIHICRRLLVLAVGTLRRCMRTLVRLYILYKWLKKHVGYATLIAKPTVNYCFQAARVAGEFVLGLLMAPERHGLMYQYKPLYKEEIRLLRLSRRGLLGGFKKSLIHISLENPPAYECISYVWGNSTKTNSVLVNGLQLPVSANVYNMLRARASLLSSRHLWIDAICINQSDEEEKTEQVQQMRIIYQRAGRVTVCLGDAPDAHLARIILQKLTMRMSGYEPSQQWRPITQSYIGHQESGGSAPKEWVALERLFKNPWFERAWVVQEVSMASEIYVLYGGIYLDWDMLMTVMMTFFLPEATMLRALIARVDEHYSWSLPAGLQNGLMMGNFRHKFRSGEKLKLHEILLVCLGFCATEPQDKIFALQGIAEEASHPLLPIDYKLKVSDVLINTAIYFLQTPHLLQVLQMAGIGWKRKHEDIPSWVVDWAMNRPLYMISYINLRDSPTAYKAATQIPPFIHYDKVKSALILKGLPFDEIDELGDSPPFYDLYMHSQTPADMRTLNTMWISFFRHAEALLVHKVPDPYHTGQNRLEALWRTLMGDKERNRPASPEHYYSYLGFKETALKKYLETLKGEGVIDEENFLTESERRFLKERERDPRSENEAFVGSWAFTNAIASACNDRRFAVTRMGYMLLAPLLVKPGDKVCLIFGADVPFILRKCPLKESRERYGERQCYYLVGESFVHGIMDGEGLGGLVNGERGDEVEDFVVL